MDGLFRVDFLNKKYFSLRDIYNKLTIAVIYAYNLYCTTYGSQYYVLPTLIICSTINSVFHLRVSLSNKSKLQIYKLKEIIYIILKLLKLTQYVIINFSYIISLQLKKTIIIITIILTSLPLSIFPLLM